MSTEATAEKAEKAQHTPGPWKVERDNDICAGDELVSCAYGFRVGGVNSAIKNTAETRANARLIAAAPELLESLKAIVEAFDNDVHMPRAYRLKGGVAVGYGEASAMTRTKAAIAKAELGS